jgi:hypothetical protein
MMMKSMLTSLVFIVAILNIAHSQSKKEQDIAAIKSMCGCYEVEFNFAETFNYADRDDYTPSKVKRTGGLEWVGVIEEGKDKISIQHLLLVGTMTNPRIIKHWRQDWEYENQDFYMYNADNQWTYVRKSKDEVEGQWSQKVFQVDDSPRYEGSASWVHIDGKSYWENTTDAPLPRREYTQRDDYNLTVRQNRHEITDFGWVHDQDNKKVVRKVGKEDFILAEEKGYNVYTKVDDSKCKAAGEWWEENKEMWSAVRNNWDKIFSRKQDLVLKEKVNEKSLFEYLFALEAKTKSREIKEIITGFVSE